MTALYETRQQGHPDPYDFYPATPEGLEQAIATAEGMSLRGRTWEVSYTPTPFERDLRYTVVDGHAAAAVAS